MYKTSFIRVTEKGATSLHDEFPLTQSHDIVLRFETSGDGRPMNAQVVPHGKWSIEPVFTLRGGDEMAASFVKLWAEMAKLHGAKPEKVISARSTAEAMQRWFDKESKK